MHRKRQFKSNRHLLFRLADNGTHSPTGGEALDEISWYILILAGLFEIGWALGLEYSDGLSKPLPTLGTVVALMISMVLLAQAVKDLPVGTAYAVWTDIGPLEPPHLACFCSTNLQALHEYRSSA